MITYEFARADVDIKDAPEGPVVVILDGKIVGKIRNVIGGWQYVTKNNCLGDVYPTFAKCRESLES